MPTLPTPETGSAARHNRREHDRAHSGGLQHPRSVMRIVDLPLRLDVVAIVVMAAAVISSIYTGRQFRLTLAAMEIDERAWVSVDSAYISPYPVTDKPRVFIDFAN